MLIGTTWLPFHTLFNWSGWNFIWCWSNSCWISWCYFWVTFSETREITAVLRIAQKSFDVGLYSDVQELIWFELGMMIDYWTLHCDANLISCGVDSRSHECEKAECLHQLSDKVYDRFRWNLVYCWDLLVWWTSHSFYLIHSVFKGENQFAVISFEKSLVLACIRTITGQFLSNLIWW